MTYLTYRPEDFVRARLDEAEQVALATDDEDWTNPYEEFQCRDGGDFEHVRSHSPARVLRDIVAKRMILDVIQADLDAGTQVFAPDRGGFERWGKAYLIACALAAPFVDHPDCSHKWARGLAALPQEET